jgi:acetyl esterase/lipase
VVLFIQKRERLIMQVEERHKSVNDWRCSPVLAPSFKKLAPAFIVTAEFDTGRDEAEFYGELMRKEGNSVEIKQYPGMPHAFAHYSHPERGLSLSREYTQDTATAIAKAHGLI